MKDLRVDLTELHRSLSQTPATEGGRTVMFMGARSGEGTSSVAAAFALLAAEQARKPVWLVDLDLKRNHQFNSFAAGPFAEALGGVGPPYSAALKTEPFFAIEPEPKEPIQGFFTAHRVGNTRLMVTRFDARRLASGQNIRIRTQPTYWQAVRAITDWAVVDAPALELSSAGLAIASQMDRTVIVVNADDTPPDDAETLRREIEAHGGRVAGVVLNRQKPDARFIDRIRR